ncbi:lysoplasmalogenase [Ilumatobacter nonamiensis]|uniref:lysoplasmalogenase n=1 Tax=Ilumatobacter nonamiensis TaxID=467093 RepID=UPI0003489745|nr:lysoplasmalogenase [Ilumatobacter nonamiensis]
MAVAVLSCIAVVCMLIDWWAVHTDHRSVERFAKPAVMLALIGVTLVADLDPTSLRPWIVGALVFGLIGDVALLPHVDRFLAGLAAFLVGHVLYIAAFVTISSSTPWILVGVVGLAAVVWVFGLPIERALRGEPMRVPVLAYVAVIGAMIIAGSATGRWPIVIGSLAFAASDGLIGVGKFVQPAADRRIPIMTLYHLGQGLIVVGCIAG